MKRSIIAAAVFSSFFMSAGVFAADVDTGTLTIKGNIAESCLQFFRVWVSQMKLPCLYML